jgi:hypothetical protein
VSDLQILPADPLDHESEIKELFLTHERPEFPEFFDRAYPSAARAGGKSWIGVDDGGRLVMHIARFPHRFVLGESTVVAGLLVNLMAAKSHRTIVPALTLLKQLIADSKATGDADFLYADPNPPGRALLKASGFSAVGDLERFVCPLADERWYADVAVRAYQTAVRIRTWNHTAKAVRHAAAGFDTAAFERPPGLSPALRPYRSPELFRQRLIGYPSEADLWFTFHASGRSTNGRSRRASAAVLVRGSTDRVATLLSVSREPSLPLSAIMPSLAGALRRAGYRRLSVFTLAGTDFAQELTRVGFVRRGDTTSVMAYALTDLGAKALRAATTWEITQLDCDR